MTGTYAVIETHSDGTQPAVTGPTIARARNEPLAVRLSAMSSVLRNTTSSPERRHGLARPGSRLVRRFGAPLFAVMVVGAGGCWAPPVDETTTDHATDAGATIEQRREQARALARGQHAEPNYEAAAAAFRKLCEVDDDAESCYAYGEALERGMGVDGDPEAAMVSFERACTSGHLVACTRMALARLAGIGAERDPWLAARLLADACASDEVYACARLALIWQRGEVGPVRLHDAALAWRRACDLDSTFCDEYGDIVRVGDVVPRDPGLAVARYAEACDHEQPYGCRALGGMLVSGDASGQPDVTSAVAAFERACALGDQPACGHKQRIEADAAGAEPGAAFPAESDRLAADGSPG